MPEISEILDDPEIVLTRDDGHTTLIGVWHGGVTFTVYSDTPAFDGWREADHFEHSDRDGRPHDEQDARESLNDRLNELAYKPA